jgi:hypothetical protein
VIRARVTATFVSELSIFRRKMAPLTKSLTTTPAVTWSAYMQRSRALCLRCSTSARCAAVAKWCFSCAKPTLLLTRYSKPSTAPNLIDSQQIRIIHPFHPLCGRSFRFVVSKKLWGEDRVTIQLADGSPFSVPVSWTDVVPADAYTSVGGGRSRFRVEDLMALADLLTLKRSR